MEETYWHPSDKAWMARRKAEWREVKYNLDVLSANWTDFKRSFHKYHKELFFFGTLNPECRSELDFLFDRPIDSFLATGHEPFLGVLPLFQIWYHPEPQALDLDRLRLDYIRYATLGLKRADFFRYYWGKGADPMGKLYSPTYGMMGGREELCVRFLCPSLDYREELPALPNQPREQAGMHPSHVEFQCRWHTAKELCMDARFVPYAPGQYLWDHLSYAMEHYPEEVFRQPPKDPNSPTREERRRDFQKLIAEILTFEQRTDPSRHRPTTIALVERLLGQYERKELSDAMLALWNETKHKLLDLKRSFAPVSVLIYMPPEEINETYSHFGGFPIDQQEARVRQWKQV